MSGKTKMVALWNTETEEKVFRSEQHVQNLFARHPKRSGWELYDNQDKNGSDSSTDKASAKGGDSEPVRKVSTSSKTASK